MSATKPPQPYGYPAKGAAGPGAGAASGAVDDVDDLDLLDAAGNPLPGATNKATQPSSAQLPPPPPPPPQMAKIKDAEEDESDDDDDDEAADPQFYLGAATVIGMACFCTFMFAFLGQFGELDTPVVWIVTFVGAFVCFLIPFVYYIWKSQALTCCDRFGDGMFGGAPFFVVGGGVFYIYVCLGLSVKNVGGSTVENKILTYCTVPMFMAVWAPLFVFLMHLQRGDARDAEAARIKAREAAKRKPRKTNRLTATIAVLRRSIIAFVCSCCCSAYATLPFFGFAWLCVGLYRAWLVHIAIPICVVAATVIIVVILALIKKTRWIVKAPVRFMYGFYTLPLLGWSPRAGDLVPKLDISLTVERRIAATNRTIEEANAAAAKGDTEKAKKLFAAAERDKAQLRHHGTHVVTVEEM